MNYIKELQEENRLLNQKIENIDQWRNDFVAHLHSEKFSGVGSDGSRKDWIATSDVLAQLSNLRAEITN
jgi:hypothetical protein